MSSDTIGKNAARVLHFLERNPCVTTKELAQHIGVARGTCTAAVKELTAKGHLVGCGFVLTEKRSSAERSPEGYVMISSPADRSKLDELENLLISNGNIGRSHVTTGGNFDYVFTFYVSHKSPEFVEFIDNVRAISNTETHTIVKTLIA